MQQTATDLGTPGKDNSYGYGLVNAGAFAMENLPPPQPVVTITPTIPYNNDDLVAHVTQGADPNGDPSPITTSGA